MSGAHFLRTAYRKSDVFLEGLLSERVHLWLKGVCIFFVQKLMPSRFGASDGFPDMPPLWVMNRMREVSDDEPELSSVSIVPRLKRVKIPTGACAVGAGYSQLWNSIDRSSEHVFISDDSSGEAFPAIIDVHGDMTQSFNVSQVLVIWTGPAANDLWPSFGRQVRMNTICKNLSVEEQAIAIGRALIEMRPRTICVASSDVGWRVLSDVADALGEYSDVYALLPTIENRSDCSASMMAKRFLSRDLSESVQLVTPSREVADCWIRHYGIDSTRILDMHSFNARVVESKRAQGQGSLDNREC